MTDFPFDMPTRAADIETRTASQVLDEIEAGHTTARTIANVIALLLIGTVLFFILIIGG